jgi:hypothetical protein
MSTDLILLNKIRNLRKLESQEKRDLEELKEIEKATVELQTYDFVRSLISQVRVGSDLKNKLYENLLLLAEENGLSPAVQVALLEILENKDSNVINAILKFDNKGNSTIQQFIKTQQNTQQNTQIITEGNKEHESKNLSKDDIQKYQQMRQLILDLEKAEGTIVDAEITEPNEDDKNEPTDQGKQ